MIVGTAGHIDHGKSALVRALTGVETDRLAEEKARGISIDLGFAYWDAAPGVRIGFVDVPGHERFVRNMLAGASGIDAVLLVVAADDGVMPQTREHLAIVDLLGIERGVVALTKCDKADSAALTLLEREIAELIQPTGLRDAAIVPVSSVTGEGLAELTAALIGLEHSAPAAAGGRFRMPIDRSFTVAGAGTIVTGSIAGGSVAVGDTVMLSPGGITARVRSLHRQNQPAGQGLAGDRCALNLVGDKVTREAVRRGMVALDPSLAASIERFDARLRLLPTQRRALQHWAPVRLHLGAAEIGARVALLQDDPLAPGSTGYVQLVLDHATAAFVGDRFVIRDTSGSRTIGGGVIVDVHPPKRRRRTLARRAMLAALDHQDAGRTLAAALALEPWAVDWPAFVEDRALDSRQAQTVADQVAHVRAGRWLIAPTTWEALRASALAEVQAFHGAHPQLLGPGRLRVVRALQPRLGREAASAVIDRLVEDGLLTAQGGALRLPGHQMGLDRTDRALWARIGPTLLGDSRFKPPRAGEVAALIAAREFDVRRVMRAMAQQGELHEIGPDHFFPRATLAEVAEICRQIAQDSEDGWFPAAALRDRLDNGRKVAIQLLEYFDRQGLTGRHGDLRRINPIKIDSFAAGEAGAAK